MTNPSELTTGEKIKNFRKRAGMSQMELENELNAATGSISRIEAGKVNPTKETILQLAKIMKLTESELSDLLGVKPLLPTEEEIISAIEECKPYLDSDNVMAYLIDENGIVYYSSKGFARMLSLDENQVRAVIGKEILEIALDPKYGIFEHLNFEKIKRVLAIEVVRISRESNIAEEYLNEVLIKIPNAKEVFELVPTVSPEEVLSTGNKQIFFNINGNKIAMSYSRERLKNNPRFEIIEYINPRSY